MEQVSSTFDPDEQATFEVSDSDNSDSESTNDDPMIESEVETTNAIVHRAAQQYGCTTTNDVRVEDIAEVESIEQFVLESCGCKFGPACTPCSKTISSEQYRDVRSQMCELTHDQLDLVVMSQLMMTTETGSSTHRNKQRQRTYSVLYHGGQRICLSTFLFLHTIGLSRFKALKSHFQARGLEPRVHGNKGKHRPTGLSLEEIEGVIKFIANYAGKYSGKLK